MAKIEYETKAERRKKHIQAIVQTQKEHQLTRKETVAVLMCDLGYVKKEAEDLVDALITLGRIEPRDPNTPKVE